MDTARDVYALAEKVAALTGRDAMALVRWAARIAKSDRPAKVAIPLQAAQRRAECGMQLPGPDFPAPAPKADGFNLRSDSEEADWP